MRTYLVLHVVIGMLACSGGSGDVGSSGTSGAVECKLQRKSAPTADSCSITRESCADDKKYLAN